MEFRDLCKLMINLSKEDIKIVKSDFSKIYLHTDFVDILKDLTVEQKLKVLSFIKYTFPDNLFVNICIDCNTDLVDLYNKLSLNMKRIIANYVNVSIKDDIDNVVPELTEETILNIEDIISHIQHTGNNGEL